MRLRSSRRRSVKCIAGREQGSQPAARTCCRLSDSRSPHLSNPQGQAPAERHGAPRQIRPQPPLAVSNCFRRLGAERSLRHGLPSAPTTWEPACDDPPPHQHASRGTPAPSERRATSLASRARSKHELGGGLAGL